MTGPGRAGVLSARPFCAAGAAAPGCLSGDAGGPFGPARMSHALALRQGVALTLCPPGRQAPKAKGQQRSHTAGRQAAQPPRPAPGGPKPGGRPTAAGAADGARSTRPQGSSAPRGGGHIYFARWLCSAQGSGRGAGYHYLIIGRYSVTLSPRGCYEQSFQGCFRGFVFGPGEAFPRRQPGGLGVRKAHLPGGGLGGTGPEGRKGSAATGATITRRPGPGHAPGPGTGAGTGVM